MEISNNIYLTYLDKNLIEEKTTEMIIKGVLDNDNMIIIENLENGIHIEDFDSNIVVYSTPSELYSKIEMYSKIYDSIHVRFFDLDMDEIKTKYSKIVNNSGVQLAFFEEFDENLFSTTLVFDPELIEDIETNEWDEIKDGLIEEMDELVEEAKQKLMFKADYSFNVQKSKKKISIEFDENRALYRIKINGMCTLLLDSSEVKEIVQILEFFVKKSRD